MNKAEGAEFGILVRFGSCSTQTQRSTGPKDTAPERLCSQCDWLDLAIDLAPLPPYDREDAPGDQEQ